MSSIVERAKQIQAEEATRTDEKLISRLERLKQLIEISGIRQYLEEARDDLRKLGKTADVALINPPFLQELKKPALVLIWGEGYELDEMDRSSLEGRLALLKAVYAAGKPDEDYLLEFNTVKFTPVSSEYEGPKTEHHSIKASFDIEDGRIIISGASPIGVIYEKDFSDREATVTALARAYLKPKSTSCAK